MRFRGGAVLALAWMVSVPARAAVDGPALLCAPATVRKAAPAAVELTVTDRFATRALDVAKPSAVCWAESPSTEVLAAYPARSARRTRRLGATVVLVTRFGTERLAVKTFAGVLVPSVDGSAPTGEPRACYAVRTVRAVERARIHVTDASGDRVFDVGRATRLCVATGGEDAPDVVCHAARLARTKLLRQARTRRGATTLTNRFGSAVVRAGAPREICVPVASEPDGTPTSPTLEIVPSAVTLIAGTRAMLTAVAHFDDGHSSDVTGSVVWHSSDETIVHVVGASPAGAFVAGVGPGTATVSVTDPATGASAHDGGVDATVMVTWPLEKLTIEPHAVTKRPGDHEGYTVTGHFTGGVTLNLTQRVVYGTSNEAIASAPNTSGNRSRVNALATGSATVSATDPISGISTTDSGNDATLHVAGALQYVTITSSPNVSTPVGQAHRLTATGHFNDGSVLDLTQQCLWSSSDPSIATAPNMPGDRSRIVGVSPGMVYVTCTDLATGTASAAAPFWTLGALQSIVAFRDLEPSQYPRTGEAVQMSAVGHYEGGGHPLVTQSVVWATRDPSLVECTKEPGHRSRVIALAGGQARVYATDAATGIVSNDAILPVLGDLISLSVDTPYPYFKFNAIPLGGQTQFAVTGIFQGGSLNLTYRGDYVLASSDRSVGTIVDGRWVHGVAPGTFELTAQDLTSGITSPPLTVTVVGGLDGLTMTPATSTRGIGEWESFTIVGHYPPSFTQNLTQDVFYTSSDPTVAVADDTFGMRSRVRTVGAGTATITADAGGGITASAVLTVLPGTIERITIEPSTAVRAVGTGFSFTALGHYPDGGTIDVTQVVTWDTLAPGVATALNEAGDRSRVRAVGAGTSGIVATHPSGVSSHDSGDDATLVAKTVASLALTPSPHVGPVGMVERYTLVGTFDDASTLNLTQDAYYFTDDSSIARADDVDGDRSAVLLRAPGITTVRAVVADWTRGGPITAGSVAGAFLEVAP